MCCGKGDLIGLLAAAVPGAFIVDTLSSQYSVPWILGGAVASSLGVSNLAVIPERAEYPLAGFGLGYFSARGLSRQPVLLSCMVGLVTAWVFTRLLAPHEKRSRDYYGRTGWGRAGSDCGDVYLTKNPTPTAGQGFPGPFEDYPPNAFNYIPL